MGFSIQDGGRGGADKFQRDIVRTFQSDIVGAVLADAAVIPGSTGAIRDHFGSVEVGHIVVVVISVTAI